MHTLRFAKAYYFAAFLLGAALAVLIALPARAASNPADYSVPESTIEKPS